MIYLQAHNGKGPFSANYRPSVGRGCGGRWPFAPALPSHPVNTRHRMQVVWGGKGQSEARSRDAETSIQDARTTFYGGDHWSAGATRADDDGRRRVAWRWPVEVRSK